MTNKTGKNKGGRPASYKEKNARIAYKLASLGANDKEIASFFGITQKTLIKWKRESEEFLQSICNGRNDGNFNVKKSLYRRALGYKFTEVTKQKIDVEDPETGEKVPATLIRTVSKHVAPDVNACLSILKRNKTNEW